MKLELLADVYQPEPWCRREVLFHKGQTVQASPASNLPDDSEVLAWIDSDDPRYPGSENPYGFALYDNHMTNNEAAKMRSLR